MELIRKLTQQELDLLRPEVEAYIAGVQAQDRLQRMTALMSGGDTSVQLDIQQGALVRPPAPELPPEFHIREDRQADPEYR